MAEYIYEVNLQNHAYWLKSELVRCKDCKHLMTYNDGTYDCKYLADRMFAEGELLNKPDDFCCWGERKEVGE